MKCRCLITIFKRNYNLLSITDATGSTTNHSLLKDSSAQVIYLSSSKNGTMNSAIDDTGLLARVLIAKRHV
jgi:hypothetical protein